MKKNNRIDKNIAIALMLTLLWAGIIGPNLAYPFHLRIPIDDTERKRGALEETSKLEYAENLRDLLHTLNNSMAGLIVAIDVLFDKDDYEKEQEILQRLDNILYPDDMEMRYDQACKIFLETNNPTEYIWEAERKISFYKSIFSKVLEFTFFSDEELEEFPLRIRLGKKKGALNIKKTCEEGIKMTKDFEARTAGRRYIKEISFAKWCKAYLESVIHAYAILARDYLLLLDIDIPDDLIFSADEYELKQIFWNLTVNSIRAMEKNRPDKPTIKVTARKTNNKLIIEVTDNGIGLDEENIKKIALEKGKFTVEELQNMNTEQIYSLIFEDWFTTREGGGQGMGIVLDNIRKYNGTISIQSQPGKGAAFTMTLPLSQETDELSRPFLDAASRKYSVRMIAKNNGALIKEVLGMDTRLETLKFFPQIQKGEIKLIAAFDKETKEPVGYGLLLPKKPNGVSFYRSYTKDDFANTGIAASLVDYCQEKFGRIELYLHLDPDLQDLAMVRGNVRGMLISRGFKPSGDKNTLVWKRPIEIASDFKPSTGDKNSTWIPVSSDKDLASGQTYAQKLKELNPTIGTGEGYVDQVFDDSVSLGSRELSRDRTFKRTKPMRFHGLDTLLFSIAEEYEDKNLKAALMGGGLLEKPEYMYSSPQAVELLAILTYGGLRALELTIIDRSQQVLNLTEFPGKYVSDNSVGYSEKMRSALERLLSEPSSYINPSDKDEYLLIFDTNLPPNTTVERVKTNFKDLNYGENELDLIVATVSLRYVFKTLDDMSERIEFFLKLTNAIKPDGKLLVDIDSFCWLVPEFHFLMGGTSHIESIKQPVREKLAEAITRFEQLLFEKYGMPLHISFYNKIAEITKLRDRLGDEETKDITSRFIKLTEPSVLSFSCLSSIVEAAKARDKL